MRRTEVASHDDDRIAEVDSPTFGVSQAAFVEDLQEQVEEVAAGLFHFVEEDDTVRFFPDGIGQFAPFFIADIARRGADQAGDAVFFHKFAHVDANHVVGTAEELSSQSPGQFGLADTGRAEEEEGTDRPVGILEAGSGPADGFSYGRDGVVLADDPFMQFFF